MRSKNLLCLSVAAVLAVGAPGLKADEPTVHWRKKDVGAADVRAALGPEPVAAVQAWWRFADDHDYRLFLTDEGRVLLLVPAKNRTAKKELALVQKTAALVDAILPSPARAEPEPAPPPPAPEDPGQDGEGGEEAWASSFQWGAGSWRRDAETVVLVQARDADDYGHALEHLAEGFEYLRGWTTSARSFSGCTLGKPLAAIWLLEDDELEEYDPENELVHRLTELLVQRRFDQQPTWLLQGIAWYVEYKLQKTHYCFPWRAEFVYEDEHSSWGAMLKAQHKGTSALKIDDVVALQRGSFQLDAARNAWGVATFLIDHHGASVPALLEDVRVLYAEKGVIRHANGSWERVPGYVPSPADVLVLLQRHAGDDVLAELASFYKKGSSYRAPK